MIRLGSKVKYQGKAGTVIGIEDRSIAVVQVDYTKEILSIPISELLTILSEGVRSSTTPNTTSRALRS